MKVDWKKVENLKWYYLVAFVVIGVPCYFLMEEDIYLPLHIESWLPFLIIVVGYIHVKYFS